MVREDEEVAASPSANEIPEVVTEGEEVDDDKVELLLLLASQTTDLSAIAYSRTDRSPPSLAAFFTSEEARSFGAFFLRIFKGFSGNLIKWLGTGEGTRISAW